MKNLVSAIFLMLTAFLCTGGWHYVIPGDNFVYGLFYRLDSADAERQAWASWFLYTGPAGALCALILSVCFLLWKRRKAG